jgi:putative CocE/NonD family hydrolase
VSRIHKVRAFVAIAVVVALVSSGQAFAATRYEASDPVRYVVRTRHGGIYVEAVHPMRHGRIVSAPAILTYSPYSTLGRNADAEAWVSRGYARVWADVIGTGNSGGCWDYGGRREQQTGYDIVEWIARQRWSTGKVAMTGGSYEGAAAIATAVRKPPHLVTIVPEVAVSRWYDYAYSGGIRYLLNNESLSRTGPEAATAGGFDTPAGFDLGLAIPPPLDVQDPQWADRVRSTIEPCDEVEHTEHGYDDTPDFDGFWRERDYVAAAGRIDVPILIGANWGDWNVKQVHSWNLFRAVVGSPKRVLFMGDRWDGHERPRGFSRLVERWLDHHLRGIDTGAEDLPPIVTRTSDSNGAGRIFRGAPKTRNVVLYAQNAPPTGGYLWQLLPSRPRSNERVPDDGTAGFTSANINTESPALHHSRNNHDWFWFEAPPFKRDVRVFGEIKVEVSLEVDREWVTLTPTIADVDMADHVMAGSQHVGVTDPAAMVGLTRGWLDSRYRSGLSRQVPIPAGGSFEMTVATKPTDYVFKAGHVVGLSIQTEINEWSVPKPYACQSAECPRININWEKARTRLVLPVVDAPSDPASLFDLGHQHLG